VKAPQQLLILFTATASAGMLGLWMARSEAPVTNVVPRQHHLLPRAPAVAVVPEQRFVPHGLDTRTWAEMDPIAALAWARSLQDEGCRLAAVEAVCLTVCDADPAQALAMARSTGLSLADLITQLVERWTRRDPAAALAHVHELGEAAERTALINRLGLVVAETDPAAAAALVAHEIQAGSDCQQALTSIVGTWALREPCRVAEWVERFPVGSVLDASVENLIDAWRQSDPAAASAWLATLPTGSARLHGQAVLANAAVQTDAEPQFSAFGAAVAYP
jgi:hypothetical protein